jgi:stage V sporulation protein AC
MDKMDAKKMKIVEKVTKETEPKRPMLKNMFNAFISGGAICLIGQIILEILLNFDLEKDLANAVMVTIMVFLGSLLTALGIYDIFGQYSGSGTIIPITGFANSMTSAALESKSEGVFLGIFVNMFKLAGSVIVVGVLSAFVFGTIRYVLGI